MTNEYSSTWFDLFLSSKEFQYHPNEKKFLLDLTSKDELNVLDIACGPGRHLRIFEDQDLAHTLVGIDIDSNAIEVAKEICPSAIILNLDMRELNYLNGMYEFDLIMILWQSFGYFDDNTNQNILESIHQLLKPNCVFLLDIYNPDFFEQFQGSRDFNKNNTKVTETKIVENKRLTVKLEYKNETKDSDIFNWRLYHPDELISIMSGIGFQLDYACTNFDLEQDYTTNSPRIQYIFRKL